MLDTPINVGSHLLGAPCSYRRQALITSFL